MPVFFLQLLALFIALCTSVPAFSQLSFDIGASSKFFSARALEEEPTPNYQGSGGTARVGYYLNGVMNFALGYESVHSSTSEMAFGGSGEAYLEQKGLALGARLLETVYIGLTYDQGVFSRDSPEEVDGLANQYQTTGVGIEFGSFLLANRRKMRAHNLQFFFKVQTLDLQTESSLYPKARVVDTVGIGLYYSFTGKQSSRSGGNLLRAFF